MMFHGLTESRIVPTGNGQQNRQHRFYCHVHGWIDLLVFPNAEDRHAKCCNTTEKSGAAAELPLATALAA